MKENTDTIKSFCIEAKNPGPHILLAAGVHGDEYEPMLTALELIRELPEILISGCVTIVPIVNVTAYRASSRYGEDNLNLARICPGKPDGSVSERNASEISTLIEESDYLVDMHTGGLVQNIYPMAGFTLHLSPEILDKQRELALAYNMPVIWGTDHHPNGRTLSVARDANIPAIYLEYGGGSGIRYEVVKTYKQGFINVLKSLNMVQGLAKIISEKDRFWVEDSRPNSGYFEGKMPSPLDGIFVSDSTPGIQIKKGQRFGRIVDPSTADSTDILAEIDGLVLSVRVSVHVKKGDALGSILPIIEPGKVIIN
ncbi:MAG TPA: succinylglutamate desuccinylase/aspartoacylase family protein [Hanamia sp.]|nr:succinylglutamate desuccinylase/aspartoacylase family protein [Hanamia sp.]